MSSVPPVADRDAESVQIRLHALTGLRWLAAFWVFGYHMQNFGSLPAPFDLPVQLGSLGVTFFFVLSGFVLTWSMRPSVKVSTFYTRRFARIWPSHMAALIIAIPVFYTLATPEFSWVKPLDLSVLILSVFLIQGFSRDPVILFSGNPAAWTLSCEMLFYAIHPWLARLFRGVSRRGALAIGAGSIAVAFAYRSLSHLTSSAIELPLPIERVPEFVLGMAIAWAFVQGWLPRVPVWLAWLIFGGTILWLTVGGDADVPFLSLWAAIFTNETATVGCALVIMAVASASLRGRRSWLETPIMVRLGNWSYAFYLVHATVMYAVLEIIGGSREPGWSNLVWGAGIFAAGLALSAAIHHWVEVPAERAIRGWKDRRDAGKLRS